MPSTDTLYQRNIELLERSQVRYREVEHEPVLTYEQAEQVRKEFKLTGTESKSLFIRLKDGRYCMFVSTEGKRFDSKKFKAAVGSKGSICSDEELIDKTGCIPKCACPFGHGNEITLVIDEDVFKTKRFIYSPGPPEKTVEIESKDIKQLLNLCENEKIYYVS